MFEKKYCQAMDAVRLDEKQRRNLAKAMVRGEKPVRRGKTSRGAAAAAAVCAILAASIVAVPAAGRLLQYFEEAPQSVYQGYAPTYGMLSAAVGTSVTDQGITVTLEDIALDSSYLTVFYSVCHADGTELTLGEKQTPQTWTAQHNAGSFSVQINGQETTKGIDEKEAYLADQSTLRVMERISLTDTIEDGDQILLELGYVLRTDGVWRFSFTADFSEPTAGQTVYQPDTEIRWPGACAVVERISMAPTGNTITFGQIQEADTVPYAGFVLRDDQGNILPLLWGTSDGWASFIGGNGSAFLELIPVSAAEETPEWTEPVPLDRLPAEEPAADGYRLLSLDVGADCAVAVYETKGAVIGESAPALRLLDAAGNILPLAAEGKDVYLDIAIDRSTGLRYLTYYYPNAEIDVPALAEQVCFYCADAYELHEEEAVYIPLTQQAKP